MFVTLCTLTIATSAVLAIGCATATAAEPDRRNIDTGNQIPTENYADQPYVVVLDNGDWVRTVTTGPSMEGQPGQHVVATISSDKGKTWSDPIDIEPRSDWDKQIPLSNWVCPYLTTYGRIYALYLWSTPYDIIYKRRDTHGFYAFRYSDDGGRTWSERHLIPYTETAWDRENIFNQNDIPEDDGTPAGWATHKPIHTEHGLIWAFTKMIAPFSAGNSATKTGFSGSQGYLYRCPNIETERDPEKLVWQMLPYEEGTKKTADMGISFPGKGEVQEEFDITALADGTLYQQFRTTKSYIGMTRSRDGGETWTEPEPMRFHLDGRIIRHPRSNTKTWRLADGTYLLWFLNNGNSGFGNTTNTRQDKKSLMAKNGIDFANRNVIWLSVGREVEGDIAWGEPEVWLYHPDKRQQISYPDLFEDEGAVYVTETQKSIGRVHELDPAWLGLLKKQTTWNQVAKDGIVLDQADAAGKSMPAPKLPDLHGPGRPGFTIELDLTVSEIKDGEIIASTMDASGKGIALYVDKHRALRLVMNDGDRTVAGRTDAETLMPGKRAHITVHVDGAADIVTFVTDGRVNDGARHSDKEMERMWGFFHFECSFMNGTDQGKPGKITPFRDVNGAGQIQLAPELSGELHRIRVYDRCLMHTEAIGNYRAARAGQRE